MNFFSSEAKVGLFAVTCVVLLFIMINMVSPGSFLTKDDTYTVVTYFDSSAGVQEKSFVRIAGVTVGRVSEISLAKGKAMVKIAINNNVTIKRDAIATIRSQGLLGEKFIEISNGTFAQPGLKDNEELVNTKTPIDIDEAVSQAGEMLKEVTSVSRSFNKVFGSDDTQAEMKDIIANLQAISKNSLQLINDNKKRLETIFKNLEDVSDVLHKNRKSFSNIVHSAESITSGLNKKIPSIIDSIGKVSSSLDEILNTQNKKNVTQILKNVSIASSKLDHTLDSLNSLLDDNNKKNVKQILTNIHRASVDLEDTIKNINGIADKINSGEGTVGKLITREDTYEKLNDTLEGVRAFVNKADQIKLFVGMRGEYQFDEGDKKSFFTLKLQSRQDRHYLLEVTNDVRKQKKSDGTNTFNDLLYTVQFSKRYNDLGLRIGLMESTFGVGADYFFLDDSLTFTIDAFNFEGYDTAVKNAQLKITSRFHFLKYLFVYGGIDEALNSKYRSIFGGAGISFNDEDLKMIISALR